MILKYVRRVLLIGVLCAFLTPRHACAQAYVRYADQHELTSRTAHVDSVLHFVPMPKGVVNLDNYPKINVAALELFRILQQGGELLQVWVCGSASPEGDCDENSSLARARAEAGVSYFKSVADIPDYKIVKESHNEDWYTLYRLVEESQMPYRYDALFIIRTMQGEERKTALKKLDDGRVWDYMAREFFPQIRGVRFAVFCRKGHEPQKEHVNDTVYVRDTVVIMKEVFYMQKDDSQQPVSQSVKNIKTRGGSRHERSVGIWDSPWLAAVKTDVATDVLALPQAGFEIQLTDRFSFETMGWYSEWSYINPSEEHKIYGFRPEIRYWMNGVMREGLFFGLHSNVTWYAMMVNDRDFYQNASLCRDKGCTGRHFYEYSYQTEDGANVTNRYHDTPAWSVGLTVGYSLPLDRGQRWAVEFVGGIGYAHYEQNWYQKSSPWTLKTIEAPQTRDYFGLTRASVNLTYRFSVRRYEKNTMNNNF